MIVRTGNRSSSGTSRRKYAMARNLLYRYPLELLMASTVLIPSIKACTPLEALHSIVTAEMDRSAGGDRVLEEKR